MKPAAAAATVVLALSSLAISSFAIAETAPPSVYAGQEGRAIKALSDTDVQDYLAGKGMGFSKVAELSSKPGPAHVIQLALQMHLSPEQLEQVRQLHRQMQADAAVLGKELVQKETALQAAVTRTPPSEEEVTRLILDAAATQGRLRAVHVLAHLKTAAILTPEQIAIYDKLRGYTTAKGDNPDMSVHMHHHH